MRNFQKNSTLELRMWKVSSIVSLCNLIPKMSYAKA